MSFSIRHIPNRVVVLKSCLFFTIIGKMFPSIGFLQHLDEERSFRLGQGLKVVHNSNSSEVSGTVIPLI